MILTFINFILSIFLAYCLFLYSTFRQKKRIYKIVLLTILYICLSGNIEYFEKVFLSIVFSMFILYKIYSFSNLIVKVSKK